eukprot:gene30395-37604_t
MNPIVRYWDETSDCYISPLRGASGSDAPVEDRKYVVFQADLGGWNNIRMGLEVVILFAQITGRILVLPPQAVLYLLHFNKRWKDNKSGVESYFDFERLKMGSGLEIMSMTDFLATVAAPGLLALPLPNNNTELSKQPLYDYLEKACFVRPWSPGKIFLGFNLTSHTNEKQLMPPRCTKKEQQQRSGVVESKDTASIYGVESDDKDVKEENEGAEYGAGSEEGEESGDSKRVCIPDDPTLYAQQLASLFGTVNQTSSASDRERVAQFAIGRELV